MSIFNLKQDEADLAAWAERELSTEGQKILAGLEAVIEKKFDDLVPTLESSLIDKLSGVISSQLGVSRDLVTKTLTDVFEGKIGSLPGDVVQGVIQGVEELLKKQTGGLL